MAISGASSLKFEPESANANEVFQPAAEVPSSKIIYLLTNRLKVKNQIRATSLIMNLKSLSFTF